MSGRTNNIPPVFASDSDSEEEFTGFNARDVRPYAAIAIKAPLFSSTPAPKRKRARVESENASSTSSDDGPGIPSVTPTRASSISSSSSSVEGELALQSGKCKPSKFHQGASAFKASENRSESSSSLEGELYRTNKTEQEEEQHQTGSPENVDIGSDESTREVVEPETPNLAARKRGKPTM